MNPIDPKNITNLCRTESELQAFWMFCISVAGKNSDYASAALSRFLSKKQQDQTPFEFLAQLGNDGIQEELVQSKIGQYNRIRIAFIQSLALDLRTCTLDDLLGVYGVGPKTARFFLLHTRKDAKYAVLDTHIMAWMRKHGVDAPLRSPHPKQYENYERIFLQMVQSHFPGVSPADVDLLIWVEQSGRLEGANEGGNIE